MKDSRKAELLREALQLLMDADALVQEALRDTCAGLDLHYGIDELVEDLRCDIVELEAV